MGALQLLARTEGILSALEPAHAIYHATQVSTYVEFAVLIVSGSWRSEPRFDRATQAIWALFLSSRVNLTLVFVVAIQSHMGLR